MPLQGKTCCEVQLSDQLLPSPFTEGLYDRVKQRIAAGVSFQLTGRVTIDGQTGVVKAKVALALQYTQELLATLKSDCGIFQQAYEYYVDACGATDFQQVSTRHCTVVDPRNFPVAFTPAQPA